jgi:transcriptional regulator with XRE-family HTH domain
MTTIPSPADSPEQRPDIHRLLVDRIRAARRERGWSAAYLAEKASGHGVTLQRHVLASLESGRRDGISVAEWLALAGALDLPPLEMILNGQAHATPDDAWLELARRNNHARQTYERLAEDYWQRFDVNIALRYRGIAEGLEMAQSNQLSVSRESRESGGVA